MLIFPMTRPALLLASWGPRMPAQALQPSPEIKAARDTLRLSTARLQAACRRTEVIALLPEAKRQD